jgi:hypothetical protein
MFTRNGILMFTNPNESREEVLMLGNILFKLYNYSLLFAICKVGGYRNKLKDSKYTERWLEHTAAILCKQEYFHLQNLQLPATWLDYSANVLPSHKTSGSNSV